VGCEPEGSARFGAGEIKVIACLFPADRLDMATDPAKRSDSVPGLDAQRGIRELGRRLADRPEYPLIRGRHNQTHGIAVDLIIVR
jgi:hypothetical protein